MTINKYTVDAGAAAVLILFVSAGWLWSVHRIDSAEKAMAEARRTASDKETFAAGKESEATAYKQKTEYLEKQIANIQAIARKQDEQLKELKNDTSAARSNAERTRGVRSVTATADELCRKLAEIGHPCE